VIVRRNGKTPAHLQEKCQQNKDSVPFIGHLYPL